MRLHLTHLVATLSLVALTSFGCKKDESAVMTAPTMAEATPAAKAAAGAPQPSANVKRTAQAEVSGPEGSKLKGVVTFVEENGKVRIEAKLDGLSPGKHGFHVHETGACDGPDFESAGGHFNPKSMDHGAHDSAMRHVGDLGNIEATEGASTDHVVEDSAMTLGEGETSVVGKAVIVHENADDLKSQPSGDAGGRLGCGIINLT